MNDINYMYKFPHLRLPVKGPYFVVLLSFIISLSMSFIAPVFPLYIKSLVGKEAYVGYVVAIIAGLLFISNFVVSKYLDLYKKRTMLAVGLIGCMITIIWIGFITNLKYFLVLEIFRTFFLVCIYITIALFIKEYTKARSLGKIEGMHFAFTNLAWLIGPFLGGLLADKYPISITFIASCIFIIAALMLIYIKPLKEEDFHNENTSSTIQNIKEYFKDKNLVILYLIAIGLMMWWAIIYTFIPLFIRYVGLDISIVGYVLVGVTIPLILLEIPIGRLADKIGFKKFFIIGFVIIGIAAMLTYFFSVVWVLLLIILASFGCACIEPLRDVYLFRKVSTRELIHKYPVYRTSMDLGHVIAPIIFSTILLYSNFRALFFFVGIFMLVFALLTFGLKDIKK